MSQFNPEDFRDSIDDMCDDAIRRMYAFQEGGLDSVMLPGDEYVSQILMRDHAMGRIEYETSTRAEIVDTIHHDVIEGEVADYAIEILSGGVITLARHAAHLGRGSTVMVPNADMAASFVHEKLLLDGGARQNKETVKLFSHELGSLGLTTLMLNYGDDSWNLAYQASRRFSGFFL